MSGAAITSASLSVSYHSRDEKMRPTTIVLTDSMPILHQYSLLDGKSTHEIHGSWIRDGSWDESVGECSGITDEGQDGWRKGQGGKNAGHVGMLRRHCLSPAAGSRKNVWLWGIPESQVVDNGGNEQRVPSWVIQEVMAYVPEK